MRDASATVKSHRARYHFRLTFRQDRPRSPELSLVAAEGRLRKSRMANVMQIDDETWMVDWGSRQSIGDLANIRPHLP